MKYPINIIDAKLKLIMIKNNINVQITDSRFL